jgi:hypothetical protein
MYLMLSDSMQVATPLRLTLWNNPALTGAADSMQNQTLKLRFVPMLLLICWRTACRWRLHPDVACSVDALLAHSSSSSSSSTDLEVPPHTAPGVDTQLRSRVQSSQGSKLLVSFESGRVPRTAVWAGVGIPPWTAAAQLDRPAPALFQRPPVAAAQFQESAAAQHQVPPVGSKRGWGHGEFDAPAGLQQHQQQQQSRKKMKTGHIGGPLHKKMSPPKKKQAPKKKDKQYYHCQ